MAITRKVLYGQKVGCLIATGLTASGQAHSGSGTFHGFLIKCGGRLRRVDVTGTEVDNEIFIMDWVIEYTINTPVSSW